MFNITYDIGCVTDVGNKKSINQDNYVVLKGSVDGKECVLAAVADGIGGLSKGEIASSITIENLKKWWDEDFSYFAKNGIDINRVGQSLELTIDEINQQIKKLIETQDLKTGTTVVIVFIYNNQYYMCNVGDSRMYLISKHNIVQVSEDHTWCKEQVLSGKMSYEQASSYAMEGVITSALGVSANYKIKSTKGNLRKQNVLLCSDGFYSYINFDNSIGDFYSKESSQDILERYKDGILETDAFDNLTAILIKRKRKLI